MALNLMKAGHELTVWNRTAAACQPLVDAGATLAGSAAEACEASDVTFVMVATPEAALACAEAAAPGLGAGKGYVDVSTVDAGTSAAISKLVKGTGAEFLEAPVSGSKAPAEQGALIFMAAGDEPLYARVKGPLEVMGKAHFFLGDVGAGAKMKLIVNSVMGSMMASFAEGLSLTEAAALDQDTLLQIISLGAINTPMYALKGPNMIKGCTRPRFRSTPAEGHATGVGAGDEPRRRCPSPPPPTRWPRLRGEGQGRRRFLRRHRRHRKK